ncbi:uncharacterized protein LOC124451896 [Xenia sp. Carnegie-2017]|uniref:uncharacterized protein LOC124451896 n=1 Tax=Xenia sp. Carnegie-2017 TaxID=2897299 RepID=UPI001F04A2ED|nr:uncharacterized protein LOC124451896 [Xenia sp. Carnegie-2017]
MALYLHDQYGCHVFVISTQRSQIISIQVKSIYMCVTVKVKGINAYTRVIYTPFDNTIKGFYFKEDKSQLVIETFSIETKKIKVKWSVMLMNTGYCSELFDDLFLLVHHANGKVALLSSESIIYIIKGSSEHDAMEVNLEWKETKSLHADISTTAVMNSEPSEVTEIRQEEPRNNEQENVQGEQRKDLQQELLEEQQEDESPEYTPFGHHDATVVSDVPKDSDLWEIAEIIYPQWLELGRILGIPEENIHKICSLIDKLPLEMLLKYKKTKGKNATANMLVEDLNAFGRRKDEYERTDQGCSRQLEELQLEEWKYFDQSKKHKDMFLKLIKYGRDPDKKV